MNKNYPNRPAQKTRYNVKKNRKKKLDFSIIGSYLILFIIFYAIFALAYVGITAARITIKEPKLQPDTYDLEYTVTKEDGSFENVTVDEDELYVGFEMYLPVSLLENFTDITVAGDNKSVSLHLNETKEKTVFSIGTANASVNDNDIVLSAESFMKDGELYLPVDFYSTMLKGMSCEINEKNSAYQLKRTEGAVGFKLKPSQSLETLNEGDYFNTNETVLEFKADLDKYEKYMNPENRDEYLFLVNAKNPLDETYIPNDLVNSSNSRSDRTVQLRLYCSMALEAFLKEAAKFGITDVSVTSGYRSYSFQNTLFQNEIAIYASYGDQAEEKAAQNVNPPGFSEHQTGLAVDMHNMPSASPAFGKTKAAQWLAANAHNFGFILRYPEDKTEITGINYEPWHFRFVGRYHATKMHELNMCLEEYIEYINQ